MINCCGAISKGVVKEGPCEEISSKKIAKWFLKQSAIIEPEEHYSQRQQHRTVKQTHYPH